MSESLKQILVHLDPSVAASERLGLARRLAQQHGAALTAIYGVTPVYVGLPYSPELAPTLAAPLMEIDNDRRDRTRRMFDEALRAPGAAAEWCEALELPIVGACAQQAFYADLMVVGQRNPGDVLTSGVPADFPEAVMVASGRPAIVVPYIGCPAKVGDKVAIAWKETREAARALTAALPILRQAAQVHVVSWDEETGSTVRGARLDLASYLRRHGVEPIWHRGGPAPGNLGEALLSRVFDLGADLLVMGCYGHSRAREWVLGGTSRSILNAMTLPVLMAH